MSTVPGDVGPFTVYVVADDLQHHGSITYDDNRDTVPDRSVPSEGLGAFQITIEYDPLVLAPGDIEPGPDLGRTGRIFQCLPAGREPGSVTFGCVSSGPDPAGVQGTLTLASITLVPQGLGLSPLSLSAEIAGPLGDSASIAVSGGAARITGAVPAPATASGSSPAPNGGASSTPRPGGATPTEPRGEQTQARTPEATAQAATQTGTRAPGNGPPPDDPGGSGGRSFGSALLWSVIVAGSIGAGGLLALAALVWRQREHRGQV